MAREENIPDDRESIVEGDPVLLVIEDDPHQARILQGLARDRGFKVIVATRGSTGLALARQFRPDAISLDIYLPDMLGWTVLNNLKFDPAMRHIPVQIITVDDERQSALAHGAFSYLVKAPTTDGIEAALERLRNFTAPRTKRLLVVEDNDIERQSIIELLDHDDIELVAVATGGEALEALRQRPFDCVVLDLRLPDVSGFELLEKFQAEPSLTTCPSWSSPAKSFPTTMRRGSRPWPRASCSRMSSRRNGCWMRRRCSCTALSPTCRLRSSRCSSGFTARTRSCRDERCWWWMTTPAISSRSRRCSKAMTLK